MRKNKKSCYDKKEEIHNSSRENDNFGPRKYYVIVCLFKNTEYKSVPEYTEMIMGNSNGKTKHRNMMSLIYIYIAE